MVIASAVSQNSYNGADPFNKLSTAFQPFFGQTANIFGRRWLIIAAVALFTLGSGIAGGAWDMPMLIAGRVVQGIGGGGIQTMIQLIICDLVPLRERGNILAVLFAAVTIGTSLGPFVGGIIIEKTTWRWVFYMWVLLSFTSDQPRTNSIKETFQ